MFKAQFKAKSPTGTWMTVGSYGTETQAISAAISKKNTGVLMVRVINKHGGIVFVG